MELDLATREDLARLESKLDKLISLLEKHPQTVTVKDICTQLRMCSSTVRYEFPWLLPNFGVSQYPGVKKWDQSVWDSWNSRPVEERRREYIEHQKEIVRKTPLSSFPE